MGIKINKEFKDLIPPLTEEEYEGLEKSLQEEGCRDAVLIWDETIIDGHTRYEICQKHNIDFKTESIEFDNEDEAKIWIINNQLARRNLPAYVKVVLETKKNDIINLRIKAKEKQSHGQTAPGKTLLPTLAKASIDTRKEIAKKAGVSHGTVQKVEVIESKAPEEVKKQLRKNEISINKAYQDIKREERQKESKEHFEKLIAEPLPKGKYRTIVVDPPWPIEKIIREVRPNQDVFDYPIQTLDEIESGKFTKAGEIPSMADDNCHLFLWTTQKFLQHSFKIIQKWGFSYIFTMVWHKDGGFQPYGLPQYNCEFVVYGRKGSTKFLDTKKFDCCFSGKRREHSRKPDEFYEVIKRVCPGPIADVFSRENRGGIDSYGNESKKF